MSSVFVSTFLLIFLAEMGDKTQLVALAFAAKYKVSQVILGILIAIFLNNLIAVTAGSIVLNFIPQSIIEIFSYSIFIAFGLWSLLGKDEDEEGKSEKMILNPFLTVAIFFFISEFGDKTQVGTMILSVKYGAPIPVLLGACAGMICANLIGIGVGMILGKNMPSNIIKLIAAYAFILVGLIGLYSKEPPISIALIFVIVAFVGLVKYVKKRKRRNK